MRIFENYPEDSICPVCGTSENKQCMLVPIDNSKHSDGDNVEAIPVHLVCILNNIRYSKAHGLMGLEANN